MTVELQMLAWSIVLGFVHIIANAITMTQQYGCDWNVGPRDEPKPPLTGVAGRLQRALRNFLETFAFFAAAVLTADAVNRHGAMPVWGAHLYFWGRLVYFPLYMAGIPVARTIAWVVATLGIALILLSLAI